MKPRLRTGCGWWVILGLALLSSSPSHGGTRASAAFLGLQGLGLGDQETLDLEHALVTKVQTSNRFDIVTRREPELAERCKNDAKCYCAGLRDPRGSTHLLIANAGQIAPLYTFELVLVDLRSCAIANTLFVSEMHNAASARTRIGQLATKLVTPKESVSETAAKAERNVEQVPVIVSVVPEKQIREHGITSLPELMRLVPGFEIVDTNWGDLVLHHGLTSTLLYMVDGVPMSNPKFNFAIYDRDFKLAINHVERVEFVRGPGSVLWGQNAFLGIVNLITRWPTDKGERLRAHVRLGTLDSQEVHASAEGNRRWLSYFVSTTWQRSVGARSRVNDSLWSTDWGDNMGAPVWGNGGTTDNAADSYYDAIAKIRIAAKLQLSVYYFKSFTNFEISPFGALLQPDDRGWWDTSNLLYSAAWEDSLPHGFTYRLSASRYEHKSWENFVIFPKNDQYLPFGFASLQGNELQPEVSHQVEGRLYHTWETARWSNRGLLGVAYLHQMMPNQLATLTTGAQEGIEELDMEAHTFNTVSAYLHDDLSLLRGRLLLSAGLRYDHHDPFQSALSTQGAVIGGVDWLRAKLTYNEGFRPPSMNSLYSTTGTKGNPSLRPERSRALSLELTSRPWGPLTLRLGGTTGWLTDLVKLVDASAEDKAAGFVNTPANQDRIRFYAAHAEVRLSWPTFNAFVNYAFKELDEENPVGNGIPLAHHTSAAGASWKIFEHFNTFATLSVVGPRPIVTGVSGFALEGKTIKPHVLLDVGFTLSNLLGMFDLTVKARNPARYTVWSPYQLNGRPTPILERRQVAEVLFTLGWSGEAPWAKLFKKKEEKKPPVHNQKTPHGGKPERPTAEQPPTQPEPPNPQPAVDPTEPAEEEKPREPGDDGLPR